MNKLLFYLIIIGIKLINFVTNTQIKKIYTYCD